MNKIIEGAKEAVKVAQCEHDLIVQPRPVTTGTPMLDKYHCVKCGATIWVPIEKWRRIGR